MAGISFEESLRQIRALEGEARAAEEQRDWHAAVAALERLVAHPCAHHQVVESEVWDDIHELRRRAGDLDEAIAAKQRAIEAGYRSVPDPEADIAECHLLAGRRGEADRRFVELAARDPDDVWLYNAAGFAYGQAGDHREAQRWLRAGIETAFRTGDPDRVIEQLHEQLQAAQRPLDEPADEELARRVEAFVAAWQPSPPHRPWGEAPEVVAQPCAHCGYTPDRAHPESELDGGHEPQAADINLAVGWFPADEWTTATQRWPQLLDELPADHAAYSRTIESRIKRIRHASAAPRLWVAVLDVDGLATYCAEHDLDPGSGAGRAAYATELSRQGHTLAWPPGRNSPCWCDSTRKYKKCCGPVPAASDDPDETATGH